MICIKNGLVNDAVNRDAYTADILVSGTESELPGKIIAIGTNLEIPEGTEIIDASGLEVYPGFVEAHCHTGLDGHGAGQVQMDYNEENDIVTPQLRAIDGINPMDEGMRAAALAGVTTVCTGPGSTNVLGGTFAAVKTWGDRIDNMIVKEAIGMKCAFGENPKNWHSKFTTSRMTTAFYLRQALAQAKEYLAKKEAAGDDPEKRPDLDMKMEALIPVLKKEIPLKAHAHAAQDFFTALRIAREFDVNITLEHVTEGHLVAEELAKENVPLAVGPTLTSASKFEMRNLSWQTPKVLAEAGCQVSIITDAQVIPQEFLPVCAGIAVEGGMDPFMALQAITIHPARHCLIADRVGSLEVGKDADIVIADGSPLTIPTKIHYVLIDGKVIKCPEDTQLR
ncbi:MAG: amidohydrolase [Anaerovoracaceae bacterium]